ncbi:MAG TPA: branched-chain amino acid ABC transporter permease [Chloroflexota bacterium]|nr:branched-chain amino acid ABC transporter permease [Chloroflexota bacterium]
MSNAGAPLLWRFRWLGLLVVCVVAAAAPLVAPNDYVGGVLDTAGTFALVAVGLNLLCGGTGQFSLGHAGFYAIGAFTAALLGAQHGWPFWLDVPAGGVLAALAGLALGIPTLRLSGPYFAVATLGFGLLVAQILSSADWAGGRTGIALNAPQIGSYTFTTRGFFWVVLVVLCLGVFVAHNLRQGATGRAFVALRESEAAAAASGVHLARYRVTAFVISALYAGLAGALFAHWEGYVSATSFGLPVSIAFVAMIVVGGLDRTAGSLIGAVALTAVQDRLQDQPQLAQTLYGAVIVVVLLFLPGGLVGLLALLRHRVAPRRKRLAPGGSHG